MTRLLAVLTLLAAPAYTFADFICVSVTPIETGFTSTLTPEPTDIYDIVVTYNPHDSPIFSLDLSIPGSFVQTLGQPVVVPGSGPVLVAGILPAADTYLSVPDSIDPGDILVAPGTAADSDTLLAAAYTVAGDTPVLAPFETGVAIATLAVPAGSPIDLPFYLGTGVLRTEAGPQQVGITCFPEPTTAALAACVLLAGACRREKPC